jgi:hypothetical protein
MHLAASRHGAAANSIQQCASPNVAQVISLATILRVMTLCNQPGGYQSFGASLAEIFPAVAIKVKRYKFGLTRLEVSMFLTIVTSSCDVHSKVA